LQHLYINFDGTLSSLFALSDSYIFVWHPCIDDVISFYTKV